MDIDILLYRLQRKWWPPSSNPLNMFNLMSNCCSWVAKIQEPIMKVTILVVGLDKAGKTSSVRGMLRVPSSLEAGPTPGCVRSELKVENYLVTLLDLGGAPEFRGFWREHYGEVHGIIFVVDSSDRPRMKEVKELLADMLKQPRVAGKPILVLANKQDKMNAVLGSELIEVLSLEKLVNQSRSLCHVEPCSASLDQRRWSDRRALRGLRWLLRAVGLEYPELCARVAEDRRPLAPEEKEKPRKADKGRRKTKEERRPSGRSELRRVHRPQEKENETKTGGKLQPIRNILQKENRLKKKLRKTKRKQVEIKDDDVGPEGGKEREDERDSNEGEQEASVQKDKASSALIPPKRGKTKRRKRVKEERPGVLEPPGDDNENEEKAVKAKGERRKKKKVVKAKRKNKINTEEGPGSYSQPVDLTATLDLYRKAILALKERQDQGR